MADGLTLAEIALVCVLVIALLPVVWLVARRRWLAHRGWVFDCSLRLVDTTPSPSWMLGVARLNGELLEWYRVFSWSLRPKFVLRRGSAQVASTRVLFADERALLFDQDRVAVLRGDGPAVEVAMTPDRMTAFLSWFESAPPGGGYR